MNGCERRYSLLGGLLGFLLIGLPTGIYAARRFMATPTNGPALTDEEARVQWMTRRRENRHG